MAAHTGETGPDFWTVVEPDTWALPPSKFSFSTILDIERCPRKWALERSAYRETLRLPHYPQKPSVAAMVGEVIHSSLERVVKAAQESHWAPSFREALGDALRSLGGIRVVVEEEMRSTLATAVATPRGAQLSGYLAARLQLEVARCREQVQAALVRIHPTVRLSGTRRGSPGDERLLAKGRALGPGLHAEQWLDPQDMPWHGKPDAILVEADGTGNLIDYKSGQIEPDKHEMQMRLYALLWARDLTRNPSGRPPASLSLIYSHGVVSVACPSETEMTALEADLRRRASEATEVLSATPPEATPSDEVCRFCGVRQLCEPFWKRAEANPASLTASGVDSNAILTSIEGCVRTERSDRLVVVEVMNCSVIPSGALVDVERRHENECRVGDRVRLIDVIAQMDGDSSNPLVRLTSLSECYRFPIGWSVDSDGDNSEPRRSATAPLRQAAKE